MEYQPLKSALKEITRVNSFYLATLHGLQHGATKQELESINSVIILTQDLLIGTSSIINEINEQQISYLQKKAAEQHCDTCPYEHTNCTKTINEDGTHTCHLPNNDIKSEKQ